MLEKGNRVDAQGKKGKRQKSPGQKLLVLEARIAVAEYGIESCDSAVL